MKKGKNHALAKSIPTLTQSGLLAVLPQRQRHKVIELAERRAHRSQLIIGENSRAISTLTRFLETPYYGGFYGPTPVTLALLRLDPLWDPLRGDPAFQKLCDEKQP
jgi:hypothetical protein